MPTDFKLIFSNSYRVFYSFNQLLLTNIFLITYYYKQRCYEHCTFLITHLCKYFCKIPKNLIAKGI